MVDIAPHAPHYKMQLGLRVLDHLGIQLYSNAAAVLSEAVANAWDADASTVSITMMDDSIVIEDDGSGMNLGDINNRFLFIGYNKRANEGGRSSLGRPFMGRKGIGKLALFSIADVVEVSTRKPGESHSFRMEVAGIKEASASGGVYEPIATSTPAPERGTRIVLSNLRKGRADGRTISALRKRIARRFSVVGLGSAFSVKVNGLPLDSTDRDDWKSVEFLWEFGETRIPDDNCPKLKKRGLLNGTVSSSHPEWLVGGWVGAVARPKNLSTDAGPLNNLVVLARGRLIQENILDRLEFNMFLGSYLTGQIEADFLDLDAEPDIATSDRQRLLEDDERYIQLVEFLRRSLHSITEEWADLRNEARGKEAEEDHPALAKWIARLPSGQQKAARRTLGMIGGVDLESEQDRGQLYRSGVLAFERLRLTSATENLGGMGSISADKLLPLLSDVSALEGELYRDIVRSRLAVIEKFEGLVDSSSKEKVLQQHLFENLWLLDPGWERAAGSERMEQTLKRDYAEFADNLSDDESKGRIDIRYRTNAGQHIIVELKRAGRRLELVDLIKQGAKYHRALSRCLKASGQKQPQISIVFVLGERVSEDEDVDSAPELVAKSLAAFNGRVVQYEELIKAARDSYAEYLEKSKSIGELTALLGSLESDVPRLGA